jgi:hypothetical protein
MIGDWEFLNNTINISSPLEASLNSSLSLLVFNSSIYVLKSTDTTILDFGDSKRLKVCSYKRENGILKHLNTWDY